MIVVHARARRGARRGCVRPGVEPLPRRRIARRRTVSRRGSRPRRGTPAMAIFGMRASSDPASVAASCRASRPLSDSRGLGGKSATARAMSRASTSCPLSTRSCATSSAVTGVLAIRYASSACSRLPSASPADGARAPRGREPWPPRPVRAWAGWGSRRRAPRAGSARSSAARSQLFDAVIVVGVVASWSDLSRRRARGRLPRSPHGGGNPRRVDRSSVDRSGRRARGLRRRGCRRGRSELGRDDVLGALAVGAGAQACRPSPRPRLRTAARSIVRTPRKRESRPAA